jgi:hypothetical protein
MAFRQKDSGTSWEWGYSGQQERITGKLKNNTTAGPGSNIGQRPVEQAPGKMIPD